MAQTAQLGGAAASANPIGAVDTLTGAVTALRGDARIELAQGDPVFQDDVVETGPGGSVNIIFNDDTNFSVGEGGSMKLDSFVYDPSTAVGEMGVTMIQGVFRFVSGNVAKLGPDAMTMETPVGTIGVRGTQGLVDVDPNAAAAGAPPVSVAMIEDPDLGSAGEITFSTPGGSVTITAPNQIVFADASGLAPTPPLTLSPNDLADAFGVEQVALLFSRDNFVIRPAADIQADIEAQAVPDAFAPAAPDAGPPVEPPPGDVPADPTENRGALPKEVVNPDPIGLIDRGPGRLDEVPAQRGDPSERAQDDDGPPRLGEAVDERGPSDGSSGRRDAAPEDGAPATVDDLIDGE
ncbi:MAG: FecR family protein, partial [Pseudomonadota bacterium]